MSCGIYSPIFIPSPNSLVVVIGTHVEENTFYINHIHNPCMILSETEVSFVKNAQEKSKHPSFGEFIANFMFNTVTENVCLVAEGK